MLNRFTGLSLTSEILDGGRARITRIYHRQRLLALTVRHGTLASSQLVLVGREGKVTSLELVSLLTTGSRLTIPSDMSSAQRIICQLMKYWDGSSVSSADRGKLKSVLTLHTIWAGLRQKGLKYKGSRLTFNLPKLFSIRVQGSHLKDWAKSM
ncbi:putative structural protein [Escherichia phage vB_EcoM_fHy-Eco03]|nr:putative structural protein [Escherichia phage vB_EcoM_fHy-Eco03]